MNTTKRKQATQTSPLQTTQNTAGLALVSQNLLTQLQQVIGNIQQRSHAVGTAGMMTGPKRRGRKPNNPTAAMIT